MKISAKNTKCSCARINHAWLDTFVSMNGHEVSILERLKSDALSVRGDFFFFAQDRIDQGAFTGTQPIALYCGKEVVKVTNWRDVFIKAVDILSEKNKGKLVAAARNFGNSYVALSSSKMRIRRNSLMLI